MRRWTLLVLCLAAQAATLTLPNQNALPGQMLVLTLSLASQGQAISAIQFDTDADPGLSLGTLPGIQIGVSAKTLYSANLPSHSLRILVLGMNNQQIADGELLRLVVLVDPAALPGVVQVRVGNVVATDPSGEAVTIPSTAATVQVGMGQATQSFSAGAIVNAGSLLSGPVSPGEIVTIFGGADLAAASDVRFNGTSAPILYAGAGQINAIVPFGLDPSKSASLEILAPGGSLGSLPLSATAVSPALFTQNSTGSGPAVVLNQDYSPNRYSNPASIGSTVMIFGTGFGLLSPLPADGQIVTGATPTTLPVTASVAGVPAKVTYAGAAPSLVAGVIQINLVIPGEIPRGPAVPVSLVVAGTPTSYATIAVQ